MAELATPLSMSQDPMIVRLRRRIAEALTEPYPFNHLLLRRAVLEALVEWDNDGQRTGHQRDAIVDAAREVLA